MQRSDEHLESTNIPPELRQSTAIWPTEEEKQEALVNLIDKKCYALDKDQKKIYDQFVGMISSFDPFVVETLLADAKAAAQEQTGLSDYFGAGVDL
jgi:hypothetical protein